MNAQAPNSKQDGGASKPSTPRRHAIVASVFAGLALGMVGMAYAAVPLYRIYCQVTGYAGTTQRAEQGSDVVLERTMQVRFDANIARGMAWRFQPIDRVQTVKIGETGLAHFHAINTSDRTITGTATFNVTPEIAGSYFSKIQCFCFTEQTLAPGEEVDMPVTYFIDPEIVNDPDAKKVTEITLSYTFFPVAKTAAKAAMGKDAEGRLKN